MLHSVFRILFSHGRCGGPSGRPRGFCGTRSDRLLTMSIFLDSVTAVTERDVAFGHGPREFAMTGTQYVGH
jgi:hypothetical protein